MSQRKKLLLLGGLSYLIPVIRKAQALGHYVITCDYLPTNPAHKYSNEYHNVSILDRNSVLELARFKQIDGIMSFAVDPGVYTAAFVAENMGLPSPGPLSSVQILQNKDLFRKFLTENNFNVPKSVSYSDIEEAVTSVHEKDLPVMVKPVDSAGSKGVSKIDNIEQLKGAVDNAMFHSFSNRIILEEFIENNGYASDSDCFSVEGNLLYITYSNQHFDNQSPNPFTPCGFSWPSTMPPETKNHLSKELQRLISLLNMRTSLYNIETRVGKDNKPYIMEVSPRGGGNRISEMIEYATETDLITLAIQSALSIPLPEIEHPTYNGHWGEITLHSNRNGILNKIQINDSITEYIVEKDLWIKPGEQVHAFASANHTLGTIILKTNNRDILEEIISNFHDYIQIHIN